MSTLIAHASRGTRSALRLAAIVLCVVLFLPGLLGLPAHAAPATAVASALQLPDGTLIRDTTSGRVYVVWAQERHWIDSAATFSALEYDSSTIISLDAGTVDTLANGTVLSLHTVAGGLVWPWAPIQANPVQLNLTQTSATAGGSLPLVAAGFQPGETVTVSAPNGVSFTAVADSQGGLTVNVPIPAGVGVGLHHVYVQGSQSGLFGVQIFHVAAPAAALAIAVTPSPVVSGTSLSVSGSGFKPDEAVQIFLNGGTSTVVVSADANGGFGSAKLPVPADLGPGTYALQVYGVSSARSTSAQVSVAAPQVATPTPTPAAPVVIVSTAVTSPGSQVVISGSGFAPGETVLIRFNGALESGISANPAGNFAGVLLTVPSGTASGTYRITATGATTQRSAGTGLIVVAPQPIPVAGIAISPLRAMPGSQVLVAGTGYQSGETVLVSLNNVLVQNLTAGAAGSFTNGSFIVPDTLGPGQYKVMAVGATSGRGATAVLTVYAKPALVSPKLYANPSTIVPGGRVTLSGSGFTAGEQMWLRLNNSLVLSFNADGSGSFSRSLPINAGPGTYSLTVTGASSRRVASTTLHVVQPVIAGIGLTPKSAHRGSVVRVSGYNFLAREVVLIRFGNTLVQATTTDGSGRFANAGFTVPGTAAYGNTYVVITGSRSGRSAREALQITPASPAAAHLKLSSTSLHRGSKVTVSGTGYQAGEIVLIRFRGAVVQAATVDSHGDYNKATFQVPVNSPYGTFTVTATGARSGRSASVNVHVTVTPPSTGISVLHSIVQRNSTITVSGHGFKAGETVLLRLNGQVVQTARADSHGNFGRTSFRLGFSAHRGKATLLATGAQSGRHAQVTITID